MTLGRVSCSTQVQTADYWFRSNGMSQDCLYRNVWTPTHLNKELPPVLVYIFGGGLPEWRWIGAAV